ncbi:hypothetical protein [Asaia bogorensis]|nr:hypothetical protein [Asaia bogorensis]
MTRQQGRLIESPLPEAVSVQGDRNEQPAFSAFIAHHACHNAAHKRRDIQSIPIFTLKDQPARRAIVKISSARCPPGVWSNGALGTASI